MDGEKWEQISSKDLKDMPDGSVEKSNPLELNA